MFLFRVKVEGESLWPELIPGRIYWASALLKPRVGDYVVFRNPRNQDRNVVKRVEKIDGDALKVGGTIERSANYEITSKNVIGKLIFGP